MWVFEDKSKKLNVFKRFVDTYKPAENLVRPSSEELEHYRDKLPAELLSFWTQYGFGSYGNGLIKIIKPSDYMDSFYPWIGGEDFKKLPIIVTGFGDVFYYRKLTDTDEDVSLLDIHYRKTSVCCWSLRSFFDDFITQKKVADELLKAQLFEQATEKFGQLNEEDIFFFVPALALGGAENIQYVSKGTATVHQSMLLGLV
ncbi:MAG: DUF1851 domain-containing protein [Zoogloeaceae bacterium]|jgi:hypothetical protein|nr:DUF1851 domain-containing protein [Zoogloeaceae bacterium]